MPSVQSTCRLAGRSLPLGIVLALLAPGAALAAARGSNQYGPLSPDLTVLARPAVASASPGQQARALGLPRSGPGSLLRHGRRVLVEAGFDHGAIASQGALREAGAQVVAASRRYQAVTLNVLPSALREVAAVPGLTAVTAVPAPIVYSTECEGGSVISEGVAQINAGKSTRESFSVTGEGVTVGVLSDSYDKSSGAATHANEDVASNDLPGNLANGCSLSQKTPVKVLSDLEPSGEEEATDEGRAMLQIVHDVAPDAKLAFASAFAGETAFAESIEKLAAPLFSGGAAAKVIVDDVAYFGEPFFQDGPIAAAIDKVTGEGVSYLTAAGNDNLFDASGREIASWEAPAFRDGGACPQAIASLGETHCMDFNPGTGVDDTFGITVQPKETLILDLQWAEPWEGVETDLDAYLLDKSGTNVLQESTSDNVAAPKRPLELLFWENPSSESTEVQLAIDHCFGACNPGASSSKTPRLKFALLENGGGVSETEYPSSRGGDEVGPTVYGHAGAASAIAVGAIPFNQPDKPEPYSSRGPVTHYFGPVNGTTPAPALESPQLIPKPDVAATDCARTTFFAFLESPSGVWRFCGTSAAAPHAAGAVALMMQKAEAEGGGLNEPEPIRAALLESAVPVGSFGTCAVGAGLVETAGALNALIAGPEPPGSLACAAPPSPLVEKGEEEPEEEVPAPTPSPAPAPRGVAPPPTTKIGKHPPQVVRTRGRAARVLFAFSSDQSGVAFLCKVDHKPYGECPRRLVRKFPLGRHVLRVKAQNGAGVADPTPASYVFRVESAG